MSQFTLPASYLSSDFNQKTPAAQTQPNLSNLSDAEQLALLQLLLQKQNAGSTPLNAGGNALSPTVSGAVTSPLGGLGAGVKGSSNISISTLGNTGTVSGSSSLSSLNIGTASAQLGALDVAGSTSNAPLGTGSASASLGGLGAAQRNLPLGVLGVSQTSSPFGAAGVGSTTIQPGAIGVSSPQPSLGVLGVAGVGSATASSATVNLSATGSGSPSAGDNTLSLLGRSRATSTIGGATGGLAGVSSPTLGLGGIAAAGTTAGITGTGIDGRQAGTIAQGAGLNGITSAGGASQQMSPEQLALLLSTLGVSGQKNAASSTLGVGLGTTPLGVQQQQLQQQESAALLAAMKPPGSAVTLADIDLPLETVDSKVLSPELLSLKKRKNILNELIDSERNYINDLMIFKEYYNDSLSVIFSLYKDNPNMSFVLMQSEVVVMIGKINKEVFGPILDLPLSQLTVQLLDSVFNEFMKKANIYSGFCCHYEDCVEKINQLRKEISKFDALLADCKGRSRKNLEMIDYLVKPFQRLTKYQLFLKSLVEALIDPAEVMLMEKTLAKITKVIDEVNSMKKTSDNRQRMLYIVNNTDGLNQTFITKDRAFLAEFEVQKMNKRGKIQRRAFFLFSDIILNCKYGSKKKYEFCKSMLYTNAEISEDLNATVRMPTDFYYKFVTFDKSEKPKNLYLSFSSLGDKKHFGDLFTKAKNDILARGLGSKPIQPAAQIPHAGGMVVLPNQDPAQQVQAQALAGAQDQQLQQQLLALQLQSGAQGALMQPQANTLFDMMPKGATVGLPQSGQASALTQLLAAQSQLSNGGRSPQQQSEQDSALTQLLGNKSRTMSFTQPRSPFAAGAVTTAGSPQLGSAQHNLTAQRTADGVLSPSSPNTVQQSGSPLGGGQPVLSPFAAASNPETNPLFAKTATSSHLPVASSLGSTGGLQLGTQQQEQQSVGIGRDRRMTLGSSTGPSAETPTRARGATMSAKGPIQRPLPAALAAKLRSSAAPAAGHTSPQTATSSQQQQQHPSSPTVSTGSTGSGPIMRALPAGLTMKRQNTAPKMRALPAGLVLRRSSAVSPDPSGDGTAMQRSMSLSMHSPTPSNSSVHSSSTGIPNLSSSGASGSNALGSSAPMNTSSFTGSAPMGTQSSFSSTRASNPFGFSPNPTASAPAGFSRPAGMPLGAKQGGSPFGTQGTPGSYY